MSKRKVNKKPKVGRVPNEEATIKRLLKKAKKHLSPASLEDFGALLERGRKTKHGNNRKS